MFGAVRHRRARSLDRATVEAQEDLALAREREALALVLVAR